MKILLRFIFNSMLLLPAVTSAGGSATIHWSNPGDYKDIKAPVGTQERFQEQTFAELETYMQKLASSLPGGQKLEMTVTNLDLAGDLRRSDVIQGYSDIRLINEMFPAKIRFHYRLLDHDGKVLKQGNESLKSMPPGGASMRLDGNKPLAIEKRMLKNWFARTINQGD